MMSHLSRKQRHLLQFHQNRWRVQNLLKKIYKFLPNLPPIPSSISFWISINQMRYPTRRTDGQRTDPVPSSDTTPSSNQPNVTERERRLMTSFSAFVFFSPLHSFCFIFYNQTIRIVFNGQSSTRFVMTFGFAMTFGQNVIAN